MNDVAGMDTGRRPIQACAPLAELFENKIIIEK
jgi:hypothetical protein